MTEEIETVIGTWFGSKPEGCGYTTDWRRWIPPSPARVEPGAPPTCGAEAVYEALSGPMPDETFLLCVEHAARARTAPHFKEWMVGMRTWHP